MAKGRVLFCPAMTQQQIDKLWADEWAQQASFFLEKMERASEGLTTYAWRGKPVSRAEFERLYAKELGRQNRRLKL